VSPAPPGAPECVVSPSFQSTGPRTLGSAGPRPSVGTIDQTPRAYAAQSLSPRRLITGRRTLRTCGFGCATGTAPCRPRPLVLADVPLFLVFFFFVDGQKPYTGNECSRASSSSGPWSLGHDDPAQRPTRHAAPSTSPRPGARVPDGEPSVSNVRPGLSSPANAREMPRVHRCKPEGVELGVRDRGACQSKAA